MKTERANVNSAQALDWHPGEFGAQRAGDVAPTVLAFQREALLPETGVVDLDTLKAWRWRQRLQVGVRYLESIKRYQTPKVESWQLHDRLYDRRWVFTGRHVQLPDDTPPTTALDAECLQPDWLLVHVQHWAALPVRGKRPALRIIGWAPVSLDPRANARTRQEVQRFVLRGGDGIVVGMHNATLEGRSAEDGVRVGRAAALMRLAAGRWPCTLLVGYWQGALDAANAAAWRAVRRARCFTQAILKVPAQMVWKTRERALRAMQRCARALWRDLRILPWRCTYHLDLQVQRACPHLVEFLRSHFERDLYAPGCGCALPIAPHLRQSALGPVPDRIPWIEREDQSLPLNEWMVSR